jgi:hypothetical protein
MKKLGRTRKVKESKRRQTIKRMKGGLGERPPMSQKSANRPDKEPVDAKADWPPEGGCESKQVETVILRVGTLIDRIGHPFGFFWSWVQRNLRGFARPASFKSRALRTLGENAYMYDINRKRVDLRNLIYGMMFTHQNDPNNKLYYVARVMKDIEGKFPCRAGTAFDYPGGALQVEFSKNVKTLIEEGYIEILTPEETRELFANAYELRREQGIDTYHPLFSDENADESKPELFETYNVNAETTALMDKYYGTTHESRLSNRNQWRLAHNLNMLNMPAPVGNAFGLKATTTTILPVPHQEDPAPPIEYVLPSMYRARSAPNGVNSNVPPLQTPTNAERVKRPSLGPNIRKAISEHKITPGLTRATSATPDVLA